MQLLDESGNVTKTYEYDSFGNEVRPEKKDENPYRYCGEYYDKETEEVYLRARYYEPGVGRFITRDTFTGENDEPLSLHLYAYCANDGVNAWDPSGHCYVTKYAYAVNGKIKYIKRWNKFCGEKIHKYKTNKKINDKYYKSAANKIKEISKITKFQNELKRFKKAFFKEKAQKKYRKIAKKAKVPRQLIAAIHYREDVNDCLYGKFRVYLHNGQKLGKKTTIAPVGKFFRKGQFVKAAIDAIHDKETYKKEYNLSYGSKDMAAMLALAEKFNGTGYTDYHDGNSPYLYSGTSLYVKGKYTEDGDYDGNLIDKQVGVFALINAIM